MPDTPFDPLKCAGAEIDRIPPCEHLLNDPTVPTTPGDIPGNPSPVDLVQPLPSLAAGGPMSSTDLVVLAEQLAAPLAETLPGVLPGLPFRAYLTCRDDGDHGWYSPENGLQGYPATFLSISVTVRGDGSTAEVQQVRVFSAPLSVGTWTLGGAVNLAYNISAIDLETALQASLGVAVTVTDLVWDTDGFFELGYEITWPAVGSQALLTGDISGMAVAALNPAKNLAPFPGTLWNSPGYGPGLPGGEVMLWLDDADGGYYFTETPCPVLLLIDSEITAGGAEHIWRANLDLIDNTGTPFNDRLAGTPLNQDIGEVVLWDPVGTYKRGDLVLASITNEAFDDGGSGHGVVLKDVYQVTENPLPAFAKDTNAPTDIAGPITAATLYVYTETGLSLGQRASYNVGLRLLAATATQQGAVSIDDQYFAGGKAFKSDRLWLTNDADFDIDDPSTFLNGFLWYLDEVYQTSTIISNWGGTQQTVILMTPDADEASFKINCEGPSAKIGWVKGSTASGEWTFTIDGYGSPRFAVGANLGQTVTISGLVFVGGILTGYDPSGLLYLPGSSVDWFGSDPTTIKEALDRLAAAVKAGSTTI